MADRVVPGPVSEADSVREAVCIDTRKIFDSCRDKDCVEDLRVYPTAASRCYIDNALSIRARSAELLYADVKVKEVGFNRGYYTVDVTYFYKICGETFPGNNDISGLAVFDKRVMLFGSQGNVKSFSSADCECNHDVPVGVVQSVDPVVLHMRISDCDSADDMAPSTIPEMISARFNDALDFSITGRRWYVTLGQFSIIRLERDTQLIVPAYDYCVPDKECVGSSEDDPCTLFGRINFPVDEFFPPDSVEPCESYSELL